MVVHPLPAGEAASLALDLGATASTSVALSQLPQDRQEDEGTQPESGLHFVLYNEQMDVVEANTGILPVDDRINRIQDLSSDRIVIQESGYLEVYVNNEAQTPVYYDNLVVMQSTGNVIEVNAYYPYGKIIQGLSTSSTYGKNNYKYNGKELQTDMDLGWLDYGARPLPTSHPVWFVPDPLAENNCGGSPYSYVDNNPISAIYPDGCIMIIIGDPAYIKLVLDAIKDLTRSKAGAAAVDKMINSKDNYIWSYSKNVTKGVNNYVGRVKNQDGTSNYYFNYTATDGSVDGVKTTPATSMAHEYSHSETYPDYKEDRMLYDKNNPQYRETGEIKKFNADEISAVDFENQVRSDLGIPLRENYIYKVIDAYVGANIGGNDYDINHTVPRKYSKTQTAENVRKKLLNQIENQAKVGNNPFEYRASKEARTNKYKDDRIGNKRYTEIKASHKVRKIGP